MEPEGRFYGGGGRPYIYIFIYSYISIIIIIFIITIIITLPFRLFLWIPVDKPTDEPIGMNQTRR